MTEPPPPGSSPPAVLVAVPTYKRPRELAALLASLARLRVAPDAARVRVLVIDNNPAGDAAAVLDEVRARGFPWPLHYAHETRPGVSYVRNRALDLAEGVDFIAFVDDDEEVSPVWLAALLATQRATGAVAVMGPVVARYRPEAPPWLICGDFHSKPIARDGPRREAGYTSNALVSVTALTAAGLRFDPAVGLIGGEDTLLFTQLRGRGGEIVDARDAIVTEAVPPEREGLVWLLRRWFRTGFTDAMVAARDAPAGHVRLSAAAKGLLRVVAGSALALAAAFRHAGGRPDRIAARLYTVSRGAGMVAFALGRPFYEYGTPQTRSAPNGSGNPPPAQAFRP